MGILQTVAPTAWAEHAHPRSAAISPAAPRAPSPPVACPILVGREAAVEALHRAIDAALAGDGRRVILISGEAGIGKSRLAAEGRAYAARQGVAVLEGACFPQDRTSPYAPLLDIVRARFAGRGPEAVGAAAEAFARELARLLPDLVTLPTDLTPAPDPGQERQRLFTALARCLADENDPRPALISVEDLQWADDASLDVLLHLTRRAAGPLVVLGTYRGEDVDPRFHGWLAQLDRERLDRELPLAPLSRDEVGVMVSAILGERAQAPADLVDLIYELAEGNPFFVEELLASLAGARHAEPSADRRARPAEGWRLPRSVRAAVQQRVSRLSPAARDVLTIAAVIGRGFDFELLQHLAQVDELALLGVIKELIAAQLVVEESPDRFAFRHALTRQAIYADLLARERLARHRAVAEAAEQLAGESGDQRLGDLAYHFSRAGVWEKALAYARRAGERARRLYAPRAAVEHLTRALEAADQLARGAAGSPVPSATLIRLRNERGQAYEQIGDFDNARADYEAAIVLAREAGHCRAEWHTLVDLGTLWTSRDFARAGAYYQQALSLARSMGKPPLIAHSLNWTGNWQINTAQPRDALPLHREAMAIFGQLGDRKGVAATLELLGMASYLSADLAGCIASIERAAALFRELDDRPRLVWCLAMLTARGGDDLLGSATSGAEDFDRAIRDGEEALELARAIGWRAGEAFAHFALARALAPRAEYGRALAHARASLRIADEIEHRQWAAEAHWALGQLHLDLFALPEAQRHLTRALELAREVQSTFWVQVATGCLAWSYVVDGDLGRAGRILGPEPHADAPVQSLGERWVTFAHMQRALGAGDAGRALRLVDRLSAPALDGTPTVESPRPALARGRALTALGRHAEAETVLRVVQAATRRQGSRALLWRTHAALGKLYRLQHRANDAEAEFEEARRIVEALAADVPDPALRETFVRATTTILPRPSRLTIRRAQAAPFGGLSAREREVVTLIARGMTNREIADALIVGERTVETHVSHVLCKLGLSSRREVARWAAERGLVGAPA